MNCAFLTDQTKIVISVSPITALINALLLTPLLYLSVTIITITITMKQHGIGKTKMSQLLTFMNTNWCICLSFPDVLVHLPKLRLWPLLSHILGKPSYCTANSKLKIAKQIQLNTKTETIHQPTCLIPSYTQFQIQLENGLEKTCLWCLIEDNKYCSFSKVSKTVTQGESPLTRKWGCLSIILVLQWMIDTLLIRLECIEQTDQTLVRIHPLEIPVFEQ